ncbi:IQ domain-containing protein E isoform X1 [Scleropages formosus]|uniref:IQ domain-containing protein E isoform X1 n=1 Tax=Scleropages formosus TaxID=113540 RepID=UPI0010FAC5B3|nr:IQ domain-containing protein E isoform X1 [Scleropages formosus]
MSEAPSDGLTDPELEELGEDELSVTTCISNSEKRPRKKKAPHKPSPSPKSPYLTSANLHSKKSALWHSLRGTAVTHSEHPSLPMPGDFWLASLKSGLELDGTQPKCSTSPSMPEYLKEAFGMRKPKYSRSSSNGYIPGTPDYKEKEDMYDEIIQLKKCLQGQKSENDIMKTKLRRLEEDNRKKEKQIEQLLDPTKGSEYTRGFVDKKNDASSVLNGLKHKILKLEQQCKEKDSALIKLQNDVKTKSIEEMKIVAEKYYEEVQRLRLLLANAESAEKSFTAECKAYLKQQKVLNSTIVKLSRNVKQLQEENETLKEELEKMTSVPSTARGYAEWSKPRLVRRIIELEKKKRRSGSPPCVKGPGCREGAGTPAVHAEEGADAVAAAHEVPVTPSGNSTQQECVHLRELVGKLREEQASLQESLADRIQERDFVERPLRSFRAQMQRLSEEKEEALKDVEKSKTIEYNKASQLFKEEIENLKETIKELEVKLQELRRLRAESSRHLIQVANTSAPRDTDEASIKADQRSGVAQLVQESHDSAGENPEHLWTPKGTKTPADVEGEEEEEDRAARIIQKHWLQYKNRERKAKDLEEDIILIQSAFRGHLTRQKSAKIKTLHEEKLPSVNRKAPQRDFSGSVQSLHVGDGDQEDGVVLLQSVFRGHLARCRAKMNSSLMGGPDTQSSAAKMQDSSPRTPLRKSCPGPANYSTNAQGAGGAVGSDGEEIEEDIPDGDTEESGDAMDLTLHGSSFRKKHIPAQLDLTAAEAAKTGDSDDSDDIIISPSRPLKRGDPYF